MKFIKEKCAGNIFLIPLTEVWKGGEITEEEKMKLEQDGISWWVVYTGTQLEERVRTVLSDMGIELNYDQIVEQRKDTFNVPKVTAVELKKKLMPFLWDDDGEMISFSLYVGSFRNFCENEENFKKALSKLS